MEVVGQSPKLLGADEHVVIHTRTHAKALVFPALALVCIGAAVGAGAALIPREARPAGQFAIALLGIVVMIWLVLVPFLRWRSTTYTITNHRLITRAGILTKIGKDLPLNRIHEVSSERGVVDRMLGCGTINVQTAAEDGTVVLRDVPDVQHVQQEITVLLFGPQPPQSWPAARG
jgi:uncharacterized membrane protein YdbT with pleckstrin-like domain